ncbi:MAG: hypothetical protein ACQEXJ_12860 [Myxococcota bacterium]
MAIFGVTLVIVASAAGCTNDPVKVGEISLSEGGRTADEPDMTVSNDGTRVAGMLSGGPLHVFREGKAQVEKHPMDWGSINIGGLAFVHGELWASSSSAHLYRFDSTGSPLDPYRFTYDIAPGIERDVNFSWLSASADGRVVAASTVGCPAQAHLWIEGQHRTLDLKPFRDRVVTAFARPAVSSDGKYVALAGTRRDGNDSSGLLLHTVETGETRILARGMGRPLVFGTGFLLAWDSEAQELVTVELERGRERSRLPVNPAPFALCGIQDGVFIQDRSSGGRQLERLTVRSARTGEELGGVDMPHGRTMDGSAFSQNCMHVVFSTSDYSKPGDYRQNMYVWKNWLD